MIGTSDVGIFFTGKILFWLILTTGTAKVICALYLTPASEFKRRQVGHASYPKSLPSGPHSLHGICCSIGLSVSRRLLFDVPDVFCTTSYEQTLTLHLGFSFFRPALYLHSVSTTVELRSAMVFCIRLGLADVWRTTCVARLWRLRLIRRSRFPVFRIRCSASARFHPTSASGAPWNAAEE